MGLGIFLILLSFSVPAQSDCSSSLFALSSYDTLRKEYVVGSKALLSDNNEIESKIYIRSDEIFSKIHMLIQQARRNVYLQTWRFTPQSKPALYFADALHKLSINLTKRKQKEPVQVWLILNIMDFQDTNHAKRQMESYLNKHHLYFENVKIHIGYFDANFLGANHSKVMSVDNKVAVVTGANFSENYNGRGFYDFGFVVKGDIVKSIDYDFVQTWISYIKTDPRPKEWGSQLKSQVKSCVPILFTKSKASPKFTDQVQISSLNNTLLNSLLFSEKSVDMITPNLNVFEFMKEMIRSVERGVTFRIILSKNFLDIAQNFPTRGGTNKKSVRDLYSHLFRRFGKAQTCKLLQIRWYSESGKNATEGSHPPNSHVKFMIVDSQVSYFGSANMDNQSWINSKEIGLFADSSKLSRHWQSKYFNPLFNQAIVVDECR